MTPATTTTTTTPPRATRCGWYRGRGGPWQLLCRGASYDDCWRELLGRTRALPPGDTIVLEAGRVPTPSRRCGIRS
jgi:hypothetical protein